ncbi:helix-turn-helix domain-containing protein [Kocuria oceani]|uniref:Helix-turn-helix domain-containing protein n=1 Tax=Kocuria oceani TaxID=988827 RepID=A0ABV9TJL2_9MICC|nr:helix-turn-helix transcriptional regulator [Kocuria oceani]
MSLDKMLLTPDHPAVRAQRLDVQPNSPGLSPDQRRRFGRKFHLERLHAGCTQADVAAAMGMHGRYAIEFVERLESGSAPEAELTRRRAQAIENRLGIPANRLLAQIALEQPGVLPELPEWPGLPPAKTRTAVDRRVEALAVLGSVAGAVFVLMGLGALVTGHLGAALALGIAGWLSLCGPLALALGRVMRHRNRRG